MDETSLSLLARAGQREDRQSWDRLAALYSPLLRRWLRAYEVQDADADDLVQDVLSSVVRDLPQFDHNQRSGAFRAWLRGILVNRLRAFWRGRDYRAVAIGGSSVLQRLNQLEDETSEVSRLWDAEHDRDVITRLLELVRPTFQPRTWEAFRRQVFDGQRADQVAMEFGMPLSSVYVARSRVLSALRREAAGLVDSL